MTWSGTAEPLAASVSWIPAATSSFHRSHWGGAGQLQGGGEEDRYHADASGLHNKPCHSWVNRKTQGRGGRGGGGGGGTATAERRGRRCWKPCVPWGLMKKTSAVGTEICHEPHSSVESWRHGRFQRVLREIMGFCFIFQTERSAPCRRVHQNRRQKENSFISPLVTDLDLGPNWPALVSRSGPVWGPERTPGTWKSDGLLIL